MTLPITITPRQLAAAVGVALAAAGLIVLLWPVTATMDTGPFGLAEQVSCGNALITEDPYGAAGRDVCSSALSGRRGWGAPMAVGGLVVAVVALFVNVSPQTREDV